jgi:hypothetical protein
MRPTPYAKKGEIEKTPKDKIKVEDLLAKDENGLPIIIWIVANNELHHVPENILTHEVLSQKDLIGASAYHLATKWEQFDYIPKNLITLKVLKERGDDNKTTWGLLIRQGRMNDVLPFIETLIDEEDLGQESFLHVCASAKQLDQVPKEFLTKNRIFDTVRRTNENVIDYAAYHGCLNQIPQEFVNEESLSLRNSNNETPLHIATEGGNLHLIPKEFLTRETLSREDSWGTVFHKAAICCTFDTFPKEFLTEEHLLQRNKGNGMNPLYILAREYCESSDPEKRNKAKKQFTELIRLLSPKNLYSLKNELEVENWLPAVAITKNEISKRKLLKGIKTEENTIEI